MAGENQPESITNSAPEMLAMSQTAASVICMQVSRIYPANMGGTAGITSRP